MLRRLAFPLSIACALPSFAAARQNSSDSATRVFARADSLRNSQTRPGLLEAVGHYRRAAALYAALGNRLWERESYTRMGWSFEALDQRDSALVQYRQVYALALRDGDPASQAATLGNIGAVMRDLGHSDSAVTYQRRALTVPNLPPNPKGESATLNNLGLAYQDLGRIDSALAVYARALRIKRELHDTNGQAIVLANLGQASSDMGHADSGVVYQREALALRRAQQSKSGQISSLNSLGILFRRLGQPDSALSYYGEGLALANGLGNKTLQARLLSNISNVLTDQGMVDSALRVSKAAIALRRAIPDRRGEGITATVIGDQYFKLGRLDSARVYTQLGLAIAREVRNPANEAYDLNNLGVIFSQLGLADSAEAALRAALPLWRSTRNLSGEAGTLTLLAEADRSLKRAGLGVALDDSAAALWSVVRARAGSDFNRVSVSEVFGNLFEAWTLAALARGEREVPERQAGMSALAASERGRAQALLALLRDSSSTDRPGANLAAEGDSLARMGTAGGTALLYYAATSDTLLSFVVSPAGTLQVLRRRIAVDSLRSEIQRFRAALQVDAAAMAQRGAALETEPAAPAAAPRRWDAGAARLAGLLLPAELQALLSGAREVLIVPQGALALVPFVALPFGERGEPFGAHYALRYATSLATLAQTQSRAHPEVFSGALVVGDPSMPEIAMPNGTRGQLSSLPGAAREARTVASLLGATALTGAAASESAIRRRLAGAPIVHFATHGFAYSSEARVRSSFVALAPDSSNDGVLSVGELLDEPAVRLGAELVVLSACQTGLGNLRQAEGTVGLQRAFLAKGARSVLVSLWNVSDAATERLMTGFYRHWLRDPDHPAKAEALRRSQEDVRRTPGFEHPRYWAAFQLVGAR